LPDPKKKGKAFAFVSSYLKGDPLLDAIYGGIAKLPLFNLSGNSPIIGKKF
jgi:hypothetical protein